ncbi:hypothetical protein [Arcicella rosea]|uniref:Uncharacterized protein n=1 Tax=Arcicella rosea TaxID=502909 RepID=A0A841EW45_9BACT|nr:hypothetical protein [Arcicella rosea]MBB6003691.1 hypothetical protein [Arcicella rosea]
MENNQEHKLDSFFRKSLENQAFPPPENLWESIAAETIHKENKKIKPMMKYLFFTSGFLMISTLMFFGIKKTTFVEANLLPPNAEIMSHTSVSDKPKTILNKETISRQNSLNEAQKLKSIEVLAFSKTKHTEPKSTKLTKDEMINNEGYSSSVILGQNSKSSNIKLKEIKHKDLILRDLSAINREKLKNKIHPLEVFEEDLPEEAPRKTGSKLSLKHPIVSFDYGVSSNTWKFKSDNSLDYNIVYPEKSSSTYLKANIAWKITEKSRMGISLAYNSYNLGKPFKNIPLWHSYWSYPTVFLNTKNGSQYYSAILPIGTINIPAERFAEVVKLTPDTLYNIRSMLMTEDHRMTTFTLGITTQNDILNLQSKKKKHLNLKIYGIADFTFQRQSSYRYIAYDALTTFYGVAGIIYEDSKKISYDSKHLENGSSFIFGVRVGLGLGWQFTPKLGLHLEGTTQNSFNSWVKNQEVNSFMRSNALSVGINLSL